MLADDECRCLAPVVRECHASIPRSERIQPRTLVPVVMRQHLLRGQPLAEVMHERGKARFELLRLTCNRINHCQCVREGIALGMKLGRLCLPLKRGDLGKGVGKEIRRTQHAKEYGWTRRGERTPQLAHQPLRRLVFELCGTRIHVTECALLHRKAELRRLPCRTQRTHGIVREML